jgi:hypothetical protein
MTTEMTTQRAAAIAYPPAEASFMALVSMGGSLLKTGFLPAHIKTGEAFAAIVLIGREMGMSTMEACRKLQCIKGTVTERADSQLARFKGDGGRSEWKELTELRAVLSLRHPNGDLHTETFTMEDARKAGLASNDNYGKHPKAMLRSRAITAGLKSIGWEGSVGIYDPEEIADLPDTRPEPASVRATPALTVTHPQRFSSTPTDADEERADPFEVAQKAIEAERDIVKLDAMRSRVDARMKDKTFSPGQADDLLDFIHARIEFLESESEVTA